MDLARYCNTSQRSEHTEVNHQLSEARPECPKRPASGAALTVDGCGWFRSWSSIVLDWLVENSV